MEFSRQYLVKIAQETNFIKDTLEKVVRLAEILKFLNNDSIFKGKLALKGGTAINLTAVELPRLSVDIDLDFTENVSREELLEVKELFSKRLTDYIVLAAHDHVALATLDTGIEGIILLATEPGKIAAIDRELLQARENPTQHLVGIVALGDDGDLRAMSAQIAILRGGTACQHVAIDNANALAGIVAVREQR